MIIMTGRDMWKNSATQTTVLSLQASLARNHFLHNAVGDEERNFHVSLQPAVTANISKSSLWWLREDSPFSRVIDVTLQQLRSFAVRAAGLVASVCGSAALLLEVEFLTSHQSKGALAQQLAAGQADKGSVRADMMVHHCS